MLLNFEFLLFTFNTMFEGKKIVLGICGSIAAYKSALLVRLLVKSGAEVQVIMTPDATNFITPLTLSTLSKKPVLVDYFASETGEWNNHVELGLWADAFIIAPATANTLAKMANGLCDNLLTAVYLSAKCPVYFAPVFNTVIARDPESPPSTFAPSRHGRDQTAFFKSDSTTGSLRVSCFQ